MTLLDFARQRLADRYPQPYHKNAILKGEWDTGTLIRAELEQLEREQAVMTETASEGK